MKKIEIIKIAEIIGRFSGKPQISYEITDKTKHGISQLISYIRSNWDDYTLIESSSIRQPMNRTIFGYPDGDPVVGKSFTINGGSWWTSEVTDIVNQNIIITRNSVYFLYDKSIERNNKLMELGI